MGNVILVSHLGKGSKDQKKAGLMLRREYAMPFLRFRPSFDFAARRIQKVSREIREIVKIARID